MVKKDLTVLEIVTYGHPVLSKKAEEIKNINQEIVDLAEKMVYTMHSAPGIGLAAPQVSRSLRLITIDLSGGERQEDLFILINPELISHEGEQVLEEGCLSVPGINEKVTRPYKVKVKGIDLKENEKIIEAEGLLARVLCHEIDHIDGKLFISRLSPLKRKLLKKKLNAPSTT
jgi:peptide deformylase